MPDVGHTDKRMPTAGLDQDQSVTVDISWPRIQGTITLSRFENALRLGPRLDQVNSWLRRRQAEGADPRAMWYCSDHRRFWEKRGTFQNHLFRAHGMTIDQSDVLLVLGLMWTYKRAHSLPSLVKSESSSSPLTVLQDSGAHWPLDDPAAWAELVTRHHTHKGSRDSDYDFTASGAQYDPPSRGCSSSTHTPLGADFGLHGNPERGIDRKRKRKRASSDTGCLPENHALSPHYPLANSAASTPAYIPGPESAYRAANTQPHSSPVGQPHLAGWTPHHGPLYASQTHRSSIEGGHDQAYACFSRPWNCQNEPVHNSTQNPYYPAMTTPSVSAATAAPTTSHVSGEYGWVTADVDHEGSGHDELWLTVDAGTPVATTNV